MNEIGAKRLDGDGHGEAELIKSLTDRVEKMMEKRAADVNAEHPGKPRHCTLDLNQNELSALARPIST